MTKNRALILPAVLLGVLFLAIAIVYWVDTAHALPSFFPGHVSASSSEATHHHFKHGVAAIAVSIVSFVFAWFQTGPSRPASTA